MDLETYTHGDTIKTIINLPVGGCHVIEHALINNYCIYILFNMIQQNLNSCMIHNYNIVACRQQVDSDLATWRPGGPSDTKSSYIEVIVAAAYRRLQV